jgi:hypothetical protein
MLPVQTIEEMISVSYVSAVVARAGSVPNTVAKDFGIDLEVRNISQHGGKRIDLGSVLALQIKSTINWILEDDYIVYDMEADAFNRLVHQRENAALPCALVLCCLSKDQSKWLTICEDDLRIEKCCYYYFIEGGTTKNSSKKRIRIPRNQLLTPESIIALKDKIRLGEIS